MKRQTKMPRSLIPLVLLLAIVGVCVVCAKAQDAKPRNPTESAQSQTQTQANQTSQLPDFAELGLSPDQIQKIRGINAELKEQRQAANQKLRQAQRALAEAVESPAPNETLIEQRSHELADAQSATIRLRSLTEARVLQVLTPEQRIKLREMRQRNQAARREANQQKLPGNILRPRQQRNPNSPGLRPNQRKLNKQAPKK